MSTNDPLKLFHYWSKFSSLGSSIRLMYTNSKKLGGINQRDKYLYKHTQFIVNTRAHETILVARINKLNTQTG